jgi:drug/metabolite transporter (DMT)-like permease
MSALWFAYLLITRRLSNQPFRKWDMHLVVVFFLLTAVLIQWTLHVFEITEIHQRRRFFAIAMGLFLFSSLVTSAIMNLRKT